MKNISRNFLYFVILQGRSFLLRQKDWHKNANVRKEVHDGFWQESAALPIGHEPLYILVLIILEKDTLQCKVRTPLKNEK